MILPFSPKHLVPVLLAVSTAVTGIIFSILRYGAYALAFQLFAGQLVANVAINIQVPLKWPRRASWRVAKKFFKLGAPASIAAYLVR